MLAVFVSCVGPSPKDLSSAFHSKRFDEGIHFERVVPAPQGIQRPEGDTWALADRLESVKLSDLLQDDRAVVTVLVFFGGADGLSERLWCGDSEQEIGLWKKLRGAANPLALQLVGVACPPVYGSGGYVDGRAAFFDAEEASPGFVSARAKFVQRTREQMHRAGDPFDQLVFDLRFRGLLNRKKDLPKSRTVEAWEGCFKAAGDKQNYGTPTIWILSRAGEVMCEPFFGNNYPDKIRYRYEDVAKAIEAALSRVERK